MIKVDPYGKEWADSDKAERLRQTVQKRIDYLEKKHNKLKAKQNLTKAQHNRLSETVLKIQYLKQAQSDIKLLGEDIKHTYSLIAVDPEGPHYVKSSDGIKVSIEYSTNALALHEIAHIRQSLEANGLEFNQLGLLRNAGTNYKANADNEVEAYKIQYSMDGTFPGVLENNGLLGINYFSVGMIDGGNSYPAIKKYSDYLRTYYQLRK